MRRKSVEVAEAPVPAALSERDAIVPVTTTAICGSDPHLVGGYVPIMQRGDVLDHEFMGEVVDVGPRVPAERLRVGCRVVVPLPIVCGGCGACRAERYSCCENSNPNAGLARRCSATRSAGLRLLAPDRGLAGGQADYTRVPFADVGPLKIESDRTDEQVLFLSDILPTGYMGAEMCDIAPGDVVAVCGAEPVGQFAMDSARCSARPR
jgi:threonine dehydrogenase-like Zn-dependent dehydrogenase